MGTRKIDIQTKLYAANCCHYAAIMSFVCVLFSPFVVWSKGEVFGTFNRFGTGSFVASASTAEFVCGEQYCVTVNIPAQWNSWSDIENSELGCSNDTNIYRDFSFPYGFCEEVDGEFKTISSIRAIQAFILLALIFLMFSACAGCAVRVAKEGGVRIAAYLTFVSMICTVVAFSLMATNTWYSDLRNVGSFIPLKGSNGRYFAMPTRGWNYGPSFVITICVFIWTALSFIYFLIAAKMISEQVAEVNDNTDEHADYAPSPEVGKNAVAQA
mmetsp:Transcript_869/g.1050  ORF Transcript_869/g.1050 Transcript_869/m.1050 type:complete len:270 (+) Transcript_869:146-955(+)